MVDKTFVVCTAIPLPSIFVENPGGPAHRAAKALTRRYPDAQA